MAACVNCGTAQGFLAFNYAGHILGVADKGLQVEPEKMPWQKPDCLCADCVPKLAKLSCRVHPTESLFFSVNLGVVYPRDSPACSRCLAEKDPTAANTRAVAAADPALARANAEVLKVAISKIIVSTGPAPWPHEILGVTSSSGGDAPLLGFLMTASRDSAFQKAEVQLRANAVQMGGHAVIHCFFEHRIAVAKDLLGSTNQAIEFFGYGTVVRRIES